jgi:hypothetical protein
MNLFGFDVRGLDTGALVMAAQVLWFVAAGVTSVWLWKKSRLGLAPRVILALACSGHFLAWFVTMFPLPNVYGTNGSLDRENHLGWTQVIVAGNSPIRSFQVNQLSFEPLWPNLVALFSLYRAEQVNLTFQLAPLVVGLLCIASIYLCVSKGLGGHDDARIEGAFAAFFALLMASTVTDQTAPFRNPWALTFILKPNHAIGLVLMPWVLLALARADSWKRRLVAGVMLQFLGWAFVIHMAYVIGGFLVFVALSAAQRSPEWKRNLTDVAVAIGINLIVVSPYLYMLTEVFSALASNARFGLAPQSAHTFDGTLRLGPVFPLAIFGAWSLWRGTSRFGRILAAQFLGAQIIWQIYLALGLVRLGREMDEAFYWIRFMTALVAGISAWRLAQRVWPRLSRLRERMHEPALPMTVAASAVLALACFTAIPGWWNPPVMDRYFLSSLRPLPARVTSPTSYLRESADPLAVVAGDRIYARYVAAFGGHRVLIAESLNPPRDLRRRAEVERALALGQPADLITEGKSRYGLKYFLVTPSLLADYPGVTEESLRSRSDLRLVYQFGSGADRIAIFELL